jgi:hypothetical protein
VIARFYKNGAELGRGRAVSGAPVEDVTTYNLAILTSLAANDVIDMRVNFATNDGYIESDQSCFWGIARLDAFTDPWSANEPQQGDRLFSGYPWSGIEPRPAGGGLT